MDGLTNGHRLFVRFFDRFLAPPPPLSLHQPIDSFPFFLHTHQYSDTIYRATSFNGYTSNPPSSQQSIQYLYRNEILTNLEELREELRCVLCFWGAFCLALLCGVCWSGAWARPTNQPTNQPSPHQTHAHTHAHVQCSYLIQERAKGSEGDWQDRSGLDDYWGRAKAAMNKYLSLAPPDDVQAVRCVLVFFFNACFFWLGDRKMCFCVFGVIGVS